jgi:hypothetical protein
MPPAEHFGQRQWVWLISSISYPFFLRLTRPSARFWSGSWYFLSILTISQVCSFVTYLAWYGVGQYHRLASVSDALNVTKLSFSESAAFFVALDLLPSFVVVAICYPLGFLGAHWLIRQPRAS